ncbi:hypothetical protein H0I29_16045 [Polaribacter sp. R2A056_3_33]|uniref:hypothetical protein n=1 Tax=Polaribacter sp. R2A056_3_33 TaxID=2745563 RepID=UPI001C4E55DE|nr:hypothetical protein [Polaribacter sp. R2A056_3_33]QXP70105.1 hypothetical protein H0I29_16045 [Polaribacter sp. R2A056_3_33]
MQIIKLSEAEEINDFTKVLRVEKGVIYLFHENNKVVNSCFVEMEDKLLKETKLLNLSNLKLGETEEINGFTKVLRVEKGVFYLFLENNKVINSCFVEMEDKLFIETKPFNRIDLR